MAENTIQRVIEIDASTSTKTVRELQTEVEQLRKKLAELQAGTDGYAAAEQKAAKAQQELNAAFEIARPDAKDLLATVEQLAEAEARDAEEVNKLVGALQAYRDAGYDVSGSLAAVSTATEQATTTTTQLDEGVNRLRESGGELIDMLVRDQQELAAVTEQRKALNKEIAQGLITEEQAREIKGELLAQETVYKNRISESRQELKAVNKTVQAAEGSYDQMSQSLGRLRDMYRQLSKEDRNSTAGQNMLNNIRNLDSELKQIDASIGNYQRNVGNYDGAIGKLSPTLDKLLQGMQNLSQGSLTFTGVIKGGIEALKGLTRQALAFIATPLGAAIMAIVLAYKAVTNAINTMNEAIEGNVELMQQQEREQTKAEAWRIEEQKATEESAKRWIKVKGAIGEAWQAVKIFYTYANTLQFGKLWKIISGVGDTKQALANIEDLKKQLHELRVGDPDEKRLGSIEQIGKLKSEIASLREKSQNQEAYNEDEREKFLREAVEKNKELYALKRRELDLQLQIAEAQHNASPDSKEFQEQWANLRNQQYTLAEQEANAERMLTRSLNKFTTDSSVDAAKKAADETEIIQQETLKIQQGLRAETEENEIKTAKENYEQDLANFNKTVKEKGISEEAAAAYRKALAEQNEADIAEIRHKYLLKAWEEQEKEDKRQEEITKKQQEAAKKDLKNDMSDLDRNAARETAEAKRDIDDPEKLEQELQNIQQRLYEAKIGLIDEMLKDETLDADTIKELSNQRADLEIKNIERVSEAEKKAADEKKKRDKLTQETALNIASSTLNSLSSIIGEETAAGKAAAVAVATIDTYKAANSAYASLASVPYVGPALGAAAAAAAIVAGIANVKKILATKEDGSNASSIASTPTTTTPAIVTPPAVIEQVPLTRTLTSASEEERLNQMASPQRVYVVYDDIAQAGQNVQVQQTESTF